MIVAEQVPWYLWAALSLALGAAWLLLRRRVHAEHPLVPFAAGLLVGLLLATTVVRAGSARPSAQDVPLGRTTGAPHPLPSPTTRTGPASVEIATDPIPSVANPRAVPANPLAVGRASWVRASLGDTYLAARLPRGTRLTICGPAGCVTGTVNDYGPSRRVHPGRIVDLSAASFRRVCGPLSMGTCAVTLR